MTPARTRIKFCGITSLEDALAAVAAGADALGFVFHPPSPRAIEADAAGAIVRQLPPLVTAVGLFVDAALEQVHEVMLAARLDLAQLHGSEDPEYCRRLAARHIKVIRMENGVDVQAEGARFDTASGILVDAYVEDKQGGTGHRFDWNRLPSGIVQPLILAGGLSPDNVGLAVRTVAPYAVDVSTGIESEPGRKDRAKMAAFVAEVLKNERQP